MLQIWCLDGVCSCVEYFLLYTRLLRELLSLAVFPEISYAVTNSVMPDSFDQEEDSEEDKCH